MIDNKLVPSEINKIETMSMTSNNINDLYPPENMTSVDFQKVVISNNDLNEGKKKQKTKEDKLKRHNTSTSFRSRDSLPPLIINEEELPDKIAKDDTFGIAITGPTFERL